MTKVKAIREIQEYFLRRGNTKSSFSSLKRSLKTLGLSDQEQIEVLKDLGFLRSDGTPHEFLVSKVKP